MDIEGKTILITGGARRVGRGIASGLAKIGCDVIIHYSHSRHEAETLQAQIRKSNGSADIFNADFNSPIEIQKLIDYVNGRGEVYGLINNAAVYDDLDIENTTLDDWDRHIRINLTAPFLLSKGLNFETPGRIINILDWKAQRPTGDHLPYMISKSGLHALTRSLAVALAPNITVNGIAFGAILPASDGTTPNNLIDKVPQERWAEMSEVVDTVQFLLAGPSYITGDVIYLDGGRHLI